MRDLSALSGRAAAAAFACFVGACLPSSPKHVGSVPGHAGATRVLGIQQAVFAFEPLPTCQLEAGTSIDPPALSPVEPASLGADALTVVERRAHVPDVRDGSAWLALRVRNGAGTERWIRNVPAPSMDEAAARWRCAVDRSTIAAAKPLDATYVRIEPTAPECSAIVPIVGTVDDVSFQNYRVLGRGVFEGASPTAAARARGEVGQVATGVSLAAEGGQARLTVDVDTFERCFRRADRTPPIPGEVRDVQGWLARDGAAPPPAISLETARDVLGIDPALCASEGSGETKHLSCSQPVVRLRTEPTPGPFGAPVIRVVRDRIGDALHFYGGTLVPASDIVDVAVEVRAESSAPAAFEKALAAAVARSNANADVAAMRSARGYRLGRAADLGPATTHRVVVGASFAAPAAAEVEEAHPIDVVARTTAPNPEYAVAWDELQSASRNLAQARIDLRLAKARGLDQDGATAHEKAATARWEAAVETIKQVPRERELETHTRRIVTTRVVHRRGDAKVDLSIRAVAPSAAVDPAFDLARTLPFDASDADVPQGSSPDGHARVASAPTDADVTTAVAEAMVAEIDRVVSAWQTARRSQATAAASAVGARSAAVAVAMRATSGRPVRLVDDALGSVDEHGWLALPTTMPRLDGDRCFVWSAVPLEGAAEASLQVGGGVRADSKRLALVVRDAHAERGAAVELCRPPAAIDGVALAVRPPFTKRQWLLSVFESTPGGVSAADAKEATNGLPVANAKLDLSRLATTVAVPAAAPAGGADRDRDGVPDASDRCPDDPETKNGYLDDDGCPDEAPAPTPPAAR